MTMNNRMNRKERRAARAGGLLGIVRGYLLPLDLNYELPVECYACGAAHKAHGVARIEDGWSSIDAPVCDACTDDQIARRFLNAPDLNVSEVTTEQLNALADKQAMTEH